MSESSSSSLQSKQARIHFVPLPGPSDQTNLISLHVREWGVVPSSSEDSDSTNTIPTVLFVHGGPGNSVADYEAANEFFFDHTKFRVFEVDQRGCGKSRPGVSESMEVMNTNYLDVSLSQLAEDFETVRTFFHLDRFDLVFGGSWGSTLALYYGLSTAGKNRCGSLILRGIFLNSREEFDAVYGRRGLVELGEGFGEKVKMGERMLREFEIFWEVGNRFAMSESLRELCCCDNLSKSSQIPTLQSMTSSSLLKPGVPLDKDDSERLIRLYEELILQGDKEAIWKFYAFECNLIVEDDDSPDYVDPEAWRKLDSDLRNEFLSASCIAAMEARLFLRGCCEDNLDLLQMVRESKNQLPKTTVVQGANDVVCPEKFARRLAEALDEVGCLEKACFVDAGHKCSSDGIKECLKERIEEFLEEFKRKEGS